MLVDLRDCKCLWQSLKLINLFLLNAIQNEISAVSRCIAAFLWLGRAFGILSSLKHSLDVNSFRFHLRPPFFARC